MTKKKKQHVLVELEMEEEDVNASFISDTTHHTSSKESRDWGAIYRYFHNEEFPIYKSEDSSANSKAPNQKADYEAYINICRSKVYHIACRPAILPFYDMIGWIIEKVDMQSRIIVNASGLMIGSFRPTGVTKMYKTRQPNRHLNQAFVRDFWEKHPSYHDTVASWCKFGHKCKVRANQRYPTIYLHEPYHLLAIMLCRIYGSPNSSLFELDWVPLMAFIIEHNYVFNWAYILYSNILNTIVKVHKL